MRKLKKTTLSMLMVGVMVASQAEAKPVTAPAMTPPPAVKTTPPEPVTTTTTPTVYRHGDCSWIPRVAYSAGWTNHEMDRLIEIIKRESGCCPRRIGGDRVDAECNVVKVVDWSHRSDSGLLQINGVHWKRDHKQYHGLVCERMGVCEQEPLLDPLTNLAAGRLLFDVAGWSPWQVNPRK
jgi:hypothetical protein